MRRSNARKPSTRKPMDPVKSQFRPKSRNPNTKLTTHKSHILIFASVAISLAFISYLFAGPRGSLNSRKRYSIVIDGGSTGTRIHVFGFRVENGVPVFDFGENGLVSMRVNPGLSAFSEDPDGAGGSLEELLEFGKGRVPRGVWGETEIRLMATAGLRRLEFGVQKRILDSCRSVLSSSGFRFRDDWASVITGSDEGMYAWITANYALGNLGGDPQQTTGIVELGGASTQVTFVSSEPMPPEFSRTVKFGNFTYNVYSHSFLHFGQNVAYESLQESLLSGEVELVNAAAESLEKGISIDPCTPKGFLHNTWSKNLSPGSLVGKNTHVSPLHARGNFSECRSAALMLLQKGKEKCSYTHCDIGSTFVPKLSGRFIATENFFFTSKFFGVAPRGFLSHLMMAGQQFCEADWSNLKRKHRALTDEDLRQYCFSSAYIVALLHDSLGIALDDDKIRVANRVGDIPLDWALGAFILQSTTDPTIQHSDWIATLIGEDSPTLLSIFAISILLLVTAWFVSKYWRKPKLKTIYDLEKGKYIITRID